MDPNLIHPDSPQCYLCGNFNAMELTILHVMQNNARSEMWYRQNNLLHYSIPSNVMGSEGP